MCSDVSYETEELSAYSFELIGKSPEGDYRAVAPHFHEIIELWKSGQLVLINTPPDGGYRAVAPLRVPLVLKNVT